VRTVYLHGFASGPNSRKARFFTERFQEEGVALETPELTPPESEGGFEVLTLTGQLRRIERLIAGEPCVVMGSSMGGYLAALYAERHPETAKVVLLAPAFCFARRWREYWGEERMGEWQATGYMDVFHYAQNREARVGYRLYEDGLQYQDYPVVKQPALVFQGREDPIVPVGFAREFAQRTPCARLVEFNSGHELTDCLEPMWDETRRFLF
jgi:pimeloyl-ACP methyl ester carboxylesterase